jgi:glycine/D-amino acid oxidase-like deaminating enzyme
MSKHYDVAVLGAGIGALTTAALLARRSWRVLVLGQGWRPPAYQYEGVTLARRPFTFLAGSSPAWGRVLVELAQTQTFRRRMVPMDPMFQILAPKLRLEVPPDAQLFLKEIDRAFPEVRRVVDDLYAELALTNAAVDAAFEKDLVWPPGSYWERRETERTAMVLPRFERVHSAGLLDDFPRDHDYRAIIEVPARFASHATELPEFALARLHGAWTRGVVRLPRGEEELVEFLVERIRAHGGEVCLGERALRVLHKRGHVTGIVLDGDEAPTGVGFVVTDHTTRALLDLTSDFDAPRRALSALPHLLPAESRFVTSIVVRDEGLPAPLADESFLMPIWPQRELDASVPLIHLQRRRESSGLSGATLLVAEAVFGEGSPPPMARTREAVLAAIESLLPFVDQHYLIIDSPHDARPLWDFRSGSLQEVDRTVLRATGASIDAEPMAERWRVDAATFHGLAAEPLRTPLEGAFAVGPSALPSLGLEGELLAAWSAARMITRTDRRRERMRREMWNKIEIG